MDNVFKNLYISDWFSSNDKHLLEQNNIKAIITLETRFKNDEILELYRKMKIDYMYIYILDDPRSYIYMYFNDAYYFIKRHIEKNENVLVHCWAGVSRSASIVLYFIMRYLSETNPYYRELSVCCKYNYALSIVKQKRNFINPNKGFVQQIKNSIYMLDNNTTII